MANVFEQSKRGGDLPRLMGGQVLTGQRYAEHTPEQKAKFFMDRERPPLMYFVEVGKAHPATNGAGFRTEAYSMQFTEDEMIQITSEWLTLMNRRRIEAANKAREQAEHDACHSKTSQPSCD